MKEKFMERIRGRVPIRDGAALTRRHVESGSRATCTVPGTMRDTKTHSVASS